MTLSFTSIPDRTGAAVYMFGDGTSQTEKALTELGDQVDAMTPEETQVVYLDPTRGEGLAVKEFYGLTVFPCISIIMDDDTVPQQWQLNIPPADQISYALSQINGSMRSS